jgi:Phage tail tube protein, GTA-gp10
MTANKLRPNTIRGEAVVAGYILRPTFTALVAAEDELGSLFALVERAASGQLRLSEMAALFWHCLADEGTLDSAVSRAVFCQAVVAAGLAAATPALKSLLGQILSGNNAQLN